MYVYHQSAIIVVLVFRLDYCGVITLIVSSFVPWLHFSFYCHDKMRMMYLIGIMTLGVICIIAVLDNRFGQPAYRPYRAGKSTVHLQCVPGNNLQSCQISHSKSHAYPQCTNKYTFPNNHCYTYKIHYLFGHHQSPLVAQIDWWKFYIP